MELAVLPVCFLVIGRWLDVRLGLQPLLSKEVAHTAAILCFAFGIPWLASSILYQHWKGEGTPFPLVPTRRLVIQGPYRYTRNPMALGAIFWLLGWALVANSTCSIFSGVGGFAFLVLSYDYFIEEQELSRRFGVTYDDYRFKTSFLFPLYTVDPTDKRP